jgi:hypothetical protein
VRRVVLDDRNYVRPVRTFGFDCPYCGKPGRWRTGGPYYDNEMICSQFHTWEPHTIVDALGIIENRKYPALRKRLIDRHSLKI